MLQETTCPRENKRGSFKRKCFTLLSSGGLRVSGRSFALQKEVAVSKIQEVSGDAYSIETNPALLAQSKKCCHKPDGKNSKAPLLNSIADSPLWRQLLSPGGAAGQLSECMYLQDRQTSTLTSLFKKAFFSLHPL